MIVLASVDEDAGATEIVKAADGHLAPASRGLFDRQIRRAAATIETKIKHCVALRRERKGPIAECRKAEASRKPKATFELQICKNYTPPKSWWRNMLRACYNHLAGCSIGEPARMTVVRGKS
jgi:hypothetical protein